MKRRFLLASIFVLGCVVGGAASHLAIPRADAGATYPRWEYLCTLNMSTDQMTQAGNEGWELTTMAHEKDQPLEMCFKRPAS